jgi:hypothetical protein
MEANEGLLGLIGVNWTLDFLGCHGVFDVYFVAA